MVLSSFLRGDLKKKNDNDDNNNKKEIDFCRFLSLLLLFLYARFQVDTGMFFCMGAARLSVCLSAAAAAKLSHGA